MSPLKLFSMKWIKKGEIWSDSVLYAQSSPGNNYYVDYVENEFTALQKIKGTFFKLSLASCQKMSLWHLITTAYYSKGRSNKVTIESLFL